MVLFDDRWSPELAPPEMSEQSIEEFLSLERTAQRIGAAILRTSVWAHCEDFADHKFVVRDVRILHEINEAGVDESQRVQILLLEGWRTPQRVWTDEADVEVIEQVQ